MRVGVELVAVLVLALGLFSSATLVIENDVPMSRIGELMQALAESRDGAPDDVTALLDALMGEILLHLEERGLPEEELASLEERFAEALGAFLAEAISQDEFGAEIAALAKEIGELGEEEGVVGLPVELLERIGLEPNAILELQGEKELTGLEIAALAQTIIGAFDPEALPAGPPEGVPSGPPSGIPSDDEEDEDDDDNGRPGGRP